MSNSLGRMNPLPVTVGIVATLGLASLLVPKTVPSVAPSSASVPNNSLTPSPVADEQTPMRHYLETSLGKREKIFRRHQTGAVRWKTVEPGIHIRTAEGEIILKSEIADPPLRHLMYLNSPLSPDVGSAQGHYDEVWTTGHYPKHPDLDYEEVYWLKKRLVVYFQISPSERTRDGHRSLIGDRKWFYQDIVWSF